MDIDKVGGGRIMPLGSHILRTTDEENGRWARVIARAGERLARAEAVRWRNIVQGRSWWDEEGRKDDGVTWRFDVGRV